jgi:hypothetical protein
MSLNKLSPWNRLTKPPEWLTQKYDDDKLLFLTSRAMGVINLGRDTPKSESELRRFYVECQGEIEGGCDEEFEYWLRVCDRVLEQMLKTRKGPFSPLELEQGWWDSKDKFQ